MISERRIQAFINKVGNAIAEEERIEGFAIAVDHVGYVDGQEYAILFNFSVVAEEELEKDGDPYGYTLQLTANVFNLGSEELVTNILDGISELVESIKNNTEDKM